MKAKHPPRILIIEDDRRLLGAIVERLEMAGYECVFAGRGDEGLTEYSHTEIDLIITDLNMPGLDGRELLRKLRADPRFVALPTIVLTTSSSDEDIQLCYRLGANSYVVKPTEFEDLVGIFRALSSFWLEVAEVPPAGPADDP